MGQLKKYKWTGPIWWVRFTKGNQVYNLDTITDDKVEKLLKEDPAYWSQKFEKVSDPPEKKKEKKSRESSSE